MINIFTNGKRNEIIKIIDEEISKLMNKAKTPEEITTIIALMEKRQNLDKDKKKLDPNTIATIAVSLLQVILMLSHEHWAPITSKALSFVIKGRV